MLLFAKKVFKSALLTCIEKNFKKHGRICLAKIINWLNSRMKCPSGGMVDTLVSGTSGRTAV